MTDGTDKDGSLGDVSATVQLSDGRLTMAADVESEMVIRDKQTSGEGPRAVFRLYGSGVAVSVELDGENLAALADEIADVDIERSED